MAKIKKERAPIWKPFIKFYTRFPIPWWQYIIAAALGFAQAEIQLRLVKYTISFNTGDLYNKVLLGYVAFTLLFTATGVLINLFQKFADQKVIFRARKLLWDKMLHMTAAQVEEEQPSKLISRLVNDVTSASGVIAMLSLFFSSAYALVRATVIMFQANVSLATWLLMALPLAIVQFWIIGKLNFKIAQRNRIALNEMTQYFAEHLGSVKYVKAQSMEEKDVSDGFKSIDKRYKADIYAAFMSNLGVVVNSVYSKSTTIITAVGGSSLMRAGEMPSDGIATFNQYKDNVNRYIAEILSQYQTLKGVQGSMQKVNELLESDSEKCEREQCMPSVEELVLENVSFGYDGKEVLQNLSLSFPKGRRTAIVGNNGSGKSTLFKLLMRFYTPNSGKIYLNGADAESIHLDEWRQSMGLVSQESPLMSGTVRANITYGVKRPYTEEEVTEAAKAADAYGFISEMPGGFDAEVGLNGCYLSGGQRQRIAIARALMVNPQILLLDEATANLDFKTDIKIRQAVEKLMAGRTVIQIAHDMAAVVSADNVVVLSDGQLEAQGTPESLAKTSETYRNYARMQNETKGGIKNEQKI